MKQNNYKAPPILTANMCMKCEKETKIWRLFTSYVKKKQPATTFLSFAVQDM